MPQKFLSALPERILLPSQPCIHTKPQPFQVHRHQNLQHDGIGSDTANDLHALPDGLGDERNNRVRQAQQTFQNGHQRVTGAAQLRLGTAVHYRLGQLQIPVAELIPGKLVQNACGDIEAEAVQRFARKILL